MNTQTNFESQKFHVRDTTKFSQDDFQTRKCLSGPPKRRPRGLQRPKKYSGRASGAPRCTVRAALRHPGAPRGAAQARSCKPLQREHDFHPARGSTWHTWRYPAPPVVRLALSPTTLSFSRLEPVLPSLPPPPDPRDRRVLLGCAHGRRPRKRSPNNDTLRGLDGTRVDCPKNVDMLNRFQN